MKKKAICVRRRCIKTEIPKRYNIYVDCGGRYLAPFATDCTIEELRAAADAISDRRYRKGSGVIEQPDCK